jgi:hypothetical protein
MANRCCSSANPRFVRSWNMAPVSPDAGGTLSFTKCVVDGYPDPGVCTHALEPSLRIHNGIPTGQSLGGNPFYKGNQFKRMGGNTAVVIDGCALSMGI